MPAQSFAGFSTESIAVKSVAVFLAVNTPTDFKYETLTQDVAAKFGRNKWKLVYDGSNRGLMGILGQTASDLGVDVHGIKPRPFLKYEERGELPGYAHQELVEDLFSQKRRMAELSHAFIILPGGFEALEEYGTIRMWSKLDVCRHPIVLLNFQNYYTPLLEWVNSATELGFISEISASLVSIANTIEQMNSMLLRPKGCAENDEQLIWSAMVRRVSTYQELQPENLLFNFVDQVACRHALTIQWSTWHTWDYHNRIEADAAEANENVWKEISLFAICVGMTFQWLQIYTLALPKYQALLNTMQSLRRFQVRYRQIRTSVLNLSPGYFWTVTA